MRSAGVSFCGVVLGLLLIGCAGSKETSTSASQGLDGVNQALQDAEATIEWASGEATQSLAYVRVTSDSVTYRRFTTPGKPGRWARGTETRRKERTHTRPIEDVKTIRAEAGSRFGRGVLLGAAPGLLLVGITALGGRDCSGPGCTITASSFFGGAAAALAGGVLGGVIGGFVEAEGEIVYRAPIDRYLSTRSP